MNGWRVRTHRQVMSRAGIGFEVCGGRGAGWNSWHATARLGRLFYGVFLTYDYPNERERA